MIREKHKELIALIEFVNMSAIMTLEQLKAFCAVVEQGGFRAAADSLFRSQSAVSIAVRKLEDELKVVLFRREGRRTELTEASRALYQRARMVLQQSEAFRSLAQHLASGEEPEIRLAVSGVVPIEPLLQELNSLTNLAPATRISLQIENLAGTMERLNDDEADIAITDVFADPGPYEVAELTRVCMVTIVHPDSAAAAKAERATVGDLEGSAQIIVRDTSIHSERLSKGIIEGTPQWTVNDFMMKRRIIKSGTGWGRMPMHLVAEDIEKGELVALQSTEFQSIAIPIYMVRKRGRPPGQVEQQLWQRLTSAGWSAASD